MNKRNCILLGVFFFLVSFNKASPKDYLQNPFADLPGETTVIKHKIAIESSTKEGNLLSFVKEAINEATGLITKGNSRRGSVLKVLVPVLSVVIILLIISAFFIVAAVFLIKARRTLREKRRKNTGRQYLSIIAEYVVNKQQFEYPSFPRLYNPLNRAVLIEQIYDLSQSLFGPKQNKLLKLFRIRKLLRHILFNFAISGKAVKATYLKLFSVVILNQNLLHKFYKYLFSKHNEIRRFAQLSLLNYDTDSLKEILDNYPYYLTLWDQIHILEIIERRATIPPDFYIYLKSNNPSVVIFGLRMIRIFYQKGPGQEIIIELLSHSYEDIRYEALKTASDLNIEGVNKVLLAYLSELGPKYKELIIEYLININMLDDNMIFQLFFNEKEDLNRLNILKTVYNNSSYGKMILEDLENYTEDENVRSMCKYILENAI